MKQHILIVEDNPTALLIEKMLMRSLDCEVEEVKSGNEALQLVIKKHDEYTLILLDLGLPDMDGTEVCQRIRTFESNKHTSHIPIIAVTGNNDPTEHQGCLDAGMEEVIVKPLTKEIASDLLIKYSVS